LAWGFVFLLNLGWLPPAGASEEQQLLRWRLKAAECEKRGAWLDACRFYEEALRRDRNHAPTREAYQRCLRRVQVNIRHRDTSYTEAVMRLPQPQALEIYGQVLVVVSSAYVERARTNPTALFQQGVQELRFALDEDGLPGASGRRTAGACSGSSACSSSCVEPSLGERRSGGSSCDVATARAGGRG